MQFLKMKIFEKNTEIWYNEVSKDSQGEIQ